MKLSDEERKAVVAYRIQKTKATLEEAEGNMQMGYWTVVANRLYYACYYIVSALLLQNGFSAQTHSGVIRLFGLHFVKQGIVPEESAKLYGKLFELRQTGDYDDIYLLTKEDVEPLMRPTREFVSVVCQLLET